MKRKIAACMCASAVLLSGLYGCGSGASVSDGGRESGGAVSGSEAERVLPFLREDWETAEYTEEDYAEALSRPYWLGNVMYNEIAIPYEETDGNYAKLLYTPERIIRVTDQTLSVVYEEGKDYVVDKENKRLVIPDGSSVPTLSTGAEYGTDIPEGFEKSSSASTGNYYQLWSSGGKGNFVYTEGPLFYGRYLSVTYAFDPRETETNPFASFDGGALSAVRTKLEAGEDIVLGVFGDSISAGCSSTGDVLHVLPYTPGYVNQLKTEIERVYGVAVTVKNGARGGTQSSWPLNEDGAASLALVREAVPDLCLIAYGMNDGTPGVTNDADALAENISAIMARVKVWAPDCEFILVNSFPSHERYRRYDPIFEEYRDALYMLEDEGGGSVKTVDMLSAGEYFLSTKRFAEISSNNVNHPNDFMHRVYAMNVMSVLYDYASAAKR